MADTEQAALPFATGGVNIRSGGQILGKYYFRTDTLYLASNRPDVKSHEVAHRLSTVLDDGGTTISARRRLGAASWLLHATMINILLGANPRRFKLLVESDVTPPRFKAQIRSVSEEDRIRLRVFRGLTHHAHQIEEFLARYEPWHRLLAEWVAIDIDSVRSNIPVDMGQVELVIDEFLRAIEAGHENRGYLLGIWTRLQRVRHPKLRVQLLRLAMTVTQAQVEKIPMGGEPLTVLRYFAEQAHTNESGSILAIEKARLAAAKTAAANIEHVREQAYQGLPADMRDGLSALEVVHKLCKEHLTARLRDLEKAASHFRMIRPQFPTRLKNLKFVINFSDIQAYYTNPERSFLVIEPAHGEYRAVFSPFFTLHLNKIGDCYWKQILLVEAFRGVIQMHGDLRCPLRHYHVWAPYFSDMAEMNRISSADPKRSCSSIECTDACPCKAILLQLGQRTNFVNHDAVCCGNRAPAWVRGTYKNISTAMNTIGKEPRSGGDED